MSMHFDVFYSIQGNIEIQKLKKLDLNNHLEHFSRSWNIQNHETWNVSVITNCLHQFKKKEKSKRNSLYNFDIIASSSDADS